MLARVPSYHLMTALALSTPDFASHTTAKRCLQHLGSDPQLLRGLNHGVSPSTPSFLLLWKHDDLIIEDKAS